MSNRAVAEFEQQMELERSRWVRRRFLWLLALSLLLSVPLMPMLWNLIELAGDDPLKRRAAVLRFSWTAVGVLLTLVCGVAVLVYRNRRRAFAFTSRLALALMAFNGLTFLPVERLAAHFEGRTVFPTKADDASTGLRVRFQRSGGSTWLTIEPHSKPQTSGAASKPSAHHGAPATLPATRVAALPSSIEATLDPGPTPSDPTSSAGGQDIGWFATLESPAFRTALLGIWLALSVHLLACLFMPWTVRESLIPAASVGAGYLSVSAVDVLTGQLGLVWVALIGLGMTACLVPGTLLCWWRYSRFRGNYRLEFESGRYRELRGELSAARRIHESVMPESFVGGATPVACRYRPMREIGGDLLTLRELPGGGRLLVVMDVTGHGVTAALMVNRLIGELDRLLGQHPTPGPGELLAGLNRYAWLMLGPHGLFLSAVVAAFDPAAGMLRYASAGHPSGYLRRHNGRVEDLPSTATLLGVMPPGEFEADDASVPLAAGEVVFWCTDGATETRGPDGHPLLTAGVRELFARAARQTNELREMASLVMASLDRYRAGEAEDDTLIVVAMVSSTPSPPKAG